MASKVGYMRTMDGVSIFLYYNLRMSAVCRFNFLVIARSRKNKNNMVPYVRKLEIIRTEVEIFFN